MWLGFLPPAHSELCAWFPHALRPASRLVGDSILVGMASQISCARFVAGVARCCRLFDPCTESVLRGSRCLSHICDRDGGLQVPGMLLSKRLHAPRAVSTRRRPHPSSVYLGGCGGPLVDCGLERREAAWPHRPTQANTCAATRAGPCSYHPPRK